jgi:integrase/recombinase XerD
MAKNQMVDIDWSIPELTSFDQVLRRFKYYLNEQGHTESTIENYIGNVKRYLAFSETDRPSLQDWGHFRNHLHDMRLARSTLNQYSYAAKAYHAMLGEELPVKRLEPHNEIPYYFNEEDVIKIFAAIKNIKHLAMLETVFYAHLRASELTSLNDEDLDLKSLTIRIREGKGGRVGIAYIHPEGVHTLKQYLAMKPIVEIDGQKPLFYTHVGRRWQRTEVSRMFERYKKQANIAKPGGLHVFGRHTPASIMIKNGCDILTIKDLLRHKDITTTARYLHVSDQTRRHKHDTFLRL